MKKNERKTNPYFNMATAIDEILMELMIEEIEKNSSKNQLTLDFNKLFIIF